MCATKHSYMPIVRVTETKSFDMNSRALYLPIPASRGAIALETGDVNIHRGNGCPPGKLMIDLPFDSIRTRQVGHRIAR